MAGSIREAGPADREQLAVSLADAFFDEPVSAWAAPPLDLRRPVLVKFFREYLRQHERYGTVWCDDDLSGAAIWSPPGKAKMGLRDTVSLVARVFHPRLAYRGPLLAWGGLAVERLQPPEQDFFYLAALGVSPSAQGQGLGSRLMAPVHELCDNDRVPAYLESSKPENVDFYARHGYRVVGEKRLPRGPLLPLMYRDPS